MHAAASLTFSRYNLVVDPRPERLHPRRKLYAVLHERPRGGVPLEKPPLVDVDVDEALRSKPGVDEILGHLPDALLRDLTSAVVPRGVPHRRRQLKAVVQPMRKGERGREDEEEREGTHAV